VDKSFKQLRQKFIAIELTGNCNNACRHCYNFWRKDGRVKQVDKPGSLSREEIISLIKKIKADIPLQYIALSGGEPLLRKDFPDILCDIVNLGMEPVVITNGVLLTEKFLKRLPRGIYFEITLLGHTAALHDRLAGRKVFDKVIRNIANINRYKSIVTLAFVAMKQNALDVHRTAELGLALGATAIMYNRVNLNRRVKSFTDDLVPPPNMLAESLGLLQETVRKYKVEAICSVPIPPCVVDISKYPDIKFGWCPRGSENAYYTVGCDGFLRPCNHSSLILGDLRKEGFAEIISNKKNTSFWNKIPEKCINCNHPLKDNCRGGCTAASYEFYGSQNIMDPFCEISMKNSQVPQ
jgi:radical SAM protein with 4Fe4S-binding SPASM domain